MYVIRCKFSTKVSQMKQLQSTGAKYLITKRSCIFNFYVLINVYCGIDLHFLNWRFEFSSKHGCELCVMHRKYQNN